MRYSKIAITIDESCLKRVDRLVRSRVFESRSQVFQYAVREKLLRLDKTRLARECAKLSKNEEQTLANEGLVQDLREWPDY